MKNTGYSLGFIHILTLIFFAAKIFGFIDWSWIWVFSPIWGALAFGLLVFILYAVLLIPDKRTYKK